MTPSQTDDPLNRARAVARILDSAVGIPGTKIRVGLDPVLGLVPGLGDVAGAALSGYVVLLGARLGAPRAVVLRMLGNVALDTIMSAVPILGDAFDVGWKSNTRNVALLERFLAKPGATQASSRSLVAAIAIILALLAIAGLALSVVVVLALVRALD